MNRGRKQGLWVGRRVPEVDENGAPILYSRYTSIEDVMQNGAAAGGNKRPKPAAGDEDAGKGQQVPKGKKSKKEQPQQQQKAANGSGAEAGVGGDDAQQQADSGDRKLSKADKRKQRRQQQEGKGQEGQAAAAAAVERAGNAEQARQIRSVLGFEGAAVKSSGFAFGFDAEVSAAAEAEAEAKLARLHAIDSADKDGYIPRRVFVGGMPYSYTREQVEEYWSWCGVIESLDMLTFPDSGRFRGIAFITFKEQAGFEAALACDGEALDGQTLKVDKCKAAGAPRRASHTPAGAPAPEPVRDGTDGKAAGGTRGGAAGSSGRPTKAPGYNVAYVGNVAFEVTREELAEVFADCSVKLVRLHTDQATGRSKGYAHVHFEDEVGLDKAMELDGHVLRGRGIRVSYGQPKRSG